MSVIQEIQELERWNHHECVCGAQYHTCSLKIYGTCPKCGVEIKQRAFGGIGTETQDVIDTVLKWAGTDEAFDAFVERHHEIHSDIDE